MAIVIALIFAWQVIGALALVYCASVFSGILSRAEGWEFVNPVWCYKHAIKVNFFGATMLSLLYSVLCPVGAIAYWFYKLCTVGRKAK